jgi:hypothetical protein
MEGPKTPLEYCGTSERLASRGPTGESSSVMITMNFFQVSPSLCLTSDVLPIGLKKWWTKD